VIQDCGVRYVLIDAICWIQNKGNFHNEGRRWMVAKRVRNLGYSALSFLGGLLLSHGVLYAQPKALQVGGLPVT